MAIDKKEMVVQTGALSWSPSFRLALESLQQSVLTRSKIGIAMPRFARRTLIVALIASHTAVTLCGPCVHALPGLSHGSVTASPDVRGHSLDSVATRHASIDHCPICHFLAQGQLPVESSDGLPAIRLAGELEPPEVSAPSLALPRLPSIPRAPPEPPESLS